MLAGNVVLDATEAAYVLGLTFKKGRCKGEPDSRRLRALVDAGHLAPINASMARPYWRFSASAVRRYIDGEVAA